MGFLKVFEGLDKSRQRHSHSETVSYLLMGTLLILFIPFIIELATSKTILDNGAVFYVPGEFSLSTMVILASTWIYARARRYKEEDKHVYLKYALLALLMLGALFLLLQVCGWQRIFLDSKAQNVKIMLVLVVVHGIHFLIALALVTALLLKIKTIRSAADNYIFFLNPRHNLFFKTTGRYWDFLGFLWMGLYIIMLLKTI